MASVSVIASKIPATRALAEFIHDLRWANIPPKVQDLLPVLLIDYYRAASVGIHQPWTQKVLAVYGAYQGPIQSSLIFSKQPIELSKAAFINGVAAGSLDWDDSHVAAIIHPGVCIWPAALAMAEHTQASGQELLEAVLAGYETAIRIGMSIQPEHSLRGFQGTPTCGAFGAAAACAKLLQLDVNGISNALGIAATFACGISQFFVSGSDIKRFHSGKAAANGVEAALLAQSGLTGPHDAIEGIQGFGRAFSDRFDPQVIVHELGQSYPTEWISLKPHASSVRMQAAIDGAIQLAQQGITVAEITSIKIGVHGAMVGKLTANQPVDFQQAQLSTPFAVAMAFSLASQRVGNFSLSIADYDQCFKDPQVLELSSRAHCYVDEEVVAKTTKESVPARVKVTLKDQTEHTIFIEFPKGCPHNPLSLEEVAQRFIQLAQHQFEQGSLHTWLNIAKTIAQQPNLKSLLNLQM